MFCATFIETYVILLFQNNWYFTIHSNSARYCRPFWEPLECRKIGAIAFQIKILMALAHFKGMQRIHPPPNPIVRSFFIWHDDVIKWKHFPRYWPFVREIHRSPVPGKFPAQRPVTQSFDVFFDLRLNKRLRKQSWGWWFETLSRPLWRHCNGTPSSPLFSSGTYTSVLVAIWIIKRVIRYS